MPEMNDTLFKQSLIYICEHDFKGALGLIINHPSNLCWDELFAQLNINPKQKNPQPVLIGGPVYPDRGIVLHSNRSQRQWQSSMLVTENICLTASVDIIQALGENTLEEDAIIAVGYSSWGAGQLEAEVAENAWLTIPATDDIIFSPHLDKKLLLAAKQLGINWHTISRGYGNA